ncbi:hypothetical protein QE152_g400 [Popillia japonica]|uniref:Uncharacterized protein n=1 Tax=Popillia japonica TaxID=7064 RepID=A0AAW1NA25_POPJA
MSFESKEKSINCIYLLAILIQYFVQDYTIIDLNVASQFSNNKHLTEIIGKLFIIIAKDTAGRYSVGKQC